MYQLTMLQKFGMFLAKTKLFNHSNYAQESNAHNQELG